MSKNRHEELTFEIAYEIIERRVKKHFHSYHLLHKEYNEGDIVNLVAMKVHDRDYISRYNKETTSEEYYFDRMVKNQLIDLQRRQQRINETYKPVSMNRDIEDGEIGDLIPAPEENLAGDMFVEQALELLSNESRSTLVGKSPLLGTEVNMSHRVLALHMINGYTPTQISKMFINPKSNRPVSSGRISQLLNEVKEQLQEKVKMY